MVIPGYGRHSAQDGDLGFESDKVRVEHRLCRGPAMGPQPRQLVI